MADAVRSCEQQKGLSERPWDEGREEHTHARFLTYTRTQKHTDLCSWYLIAAISSWLRADQAAKQRVCRDKPCRAEGLRLPSPGETLEVLAAVKKRRHRGHVNSGHGENLCLENYHYRTSQNRQEHGTSSHAQISRTAGGSSRTNGTRDREVHLYSKVQRSNRSSLLFSKDLRGVRLSSHAGMIIFTIWAHMNARHNVISSGILFVFFSLSADEEQR